MAEYKKRFLMKPIFTKNDGNLGGAGRNRTDDLLLAKQALSQLSYTPVMVGLRRVELLTSPLSGVRSNQLSYRPGNVSLASLI